METKSIWKWLLLVVLVSAALATVLPVKQKVKFGLDLKGGSSFVLQIDQAAIERQVREENPNLTDDEVARKVQSILTGAQERALEVIRNRVDGLGISEPVIYPEKGNRIVVQLPGVGEAKRLEALETIKKAAFLEFRLVHPSDEQLVEKLFERGVAPDGYVIVSSEEGGVRGEFYKRDKNAVPDAKVDADFRAKLTQFQAKPGFEFMLERVRKEGGEELFRPHFVSKRRELSGDSVTKAGIDYKALGQPVVTLQFDAKGTRQFRQVTTDYAPGGPKNPGQGYRLLAIILDGTLYSSPRINEPIPSGRAEISGNFTPSEATFLANVLRAGSLPAPMNVIESRTVDPSLGVDSIRSGIHASIWGGVAVAVFMAGYYLLAGVIADVAMILNLVLLPLGMILVAGFLGVFTGGLSTGAISLPVLTMPGIAGFVLSIGMAVDANVLIFERIREELSAGKSLKAAIVAGFHRAFPAIFDSHVTTIISAVILFYMGSGPVRGFAITLTAGLLVNLYTAVTITRLFMDTAVDTGMVSNLKMFHLIRSTNIDFISKWKIAMGATIAIIVVTCGLGVMHGMKNPASVFSVDFLGGSAMTFSFQQKPDVEDVRATLAAAGVTDAGVQFEKSLEKLGEDRLQIKTSFGDADTAKAALLTKYENAGFKVMQEDKIGPQVGRELKSKAVWAVLISFVAMVIYIAIRFEFGFALGAIVATLHDTFFTVGVFLMFPHRQLNLTVVAAVMTIIGYSMNDTVVVFDRIRENIRLLRGKSFSEIANFSVNQMLGRTILTSLTVFLADLMLFLFGGGAINDFALTMLIGVIVGTFSSVYIATPVALLWYGNKAPDFGPKPVK